MKHIAFILISIGLLALPACSNETYYEKDMKLSSENIIAFDELRIELDSEGYIAKPEWMKSLVGDKDYTGKIFTVLYFAGIYVDGIPYIIPGNVSSAAAYPASSPIFKINGKRLDGDSPEYQKVCASQGVSRMLWTRPQSERPVISSFKELDIKLDSKGFIAEPAWMKALVDDSKMPLPDGGYTYGIMYFHGVYVGNTPYIETGIVVSSDLCTSIQVYRLNGERLSCDSPEYKEIVFNTDRATYSTLWFIPFRE